MALTPQEFGIRLGAMEMGEQETFRRLFIDPPPEGAFIHFRRARTNTRNPSETYDINDGSHPKQKPRTGSMCWKQVARERAMTWFIVMDYQEFSRGGSLL